LKLGWIGLTDRNSLAAGVACAKGHNGRSIGAYGTETDRYKRGHYRE
jgi:hypothetical protein